MPSQIQALSSHTSTTVKFQWKLTDFSKLGSEHKSVVFSVGNLKWRVEIDPRGSSNTDDHSSLFLIPVDKTILPYAEFSVVITSQTDSKNNFELPVEKHQFTQADSGWGWPKLMSLAELHNNSKGYLLHDTCIIQVVITCQTSGENAAADTTGQTRGENLAVATGQTSVVNAAVVIVLCIFYGYWLLGCRN
ncbi:hypothetical protein MKX03_028650 [Papaver bracteatum]|nr:hypothetical protein MKX03_028650 [Papaver bracteatum]